MIDRHTVMRNAIAALDVCPSFSVPLKDSIIETIIIEIAMPRDPNIMGFFRPSLSSPIEGIKEPTANENSIHPATASAMVFDRPTLVSRIVGA